MRIITLLFCLLALAQPLAAAPRHVIVIAMENKDAKEGGIGGHTHIYGNMTDAPYINGVLMHEAARAANFVDELMKDRSQPHYILMEAGRSEFEDTHFKCDNDPGKSCDLVMGKPNWTKSREHLTAQIEAARKPSLTWMTYQEGLDPRRTGACPVHSAGLYAAKHNPFVYFADAAGDPPSADNAHCIAHTRDLSQFAADMKANTLANYVFVTPDLCNDMHGARRCKGNDITNGDSFLASFLPPLLTWAKANKAVVFIAWDEGKTAKTIPFFAAGWGIKGGYESKERYSHRAMLRTIEAFLGLPALSAVAKAPVMSDLFEPGVLP